MSFGRTSRQLILLAATVGLFASNTAAAAAPADFCTSLKRVIAAAAETPSYKSIAGKPNDKYTIPGTLVLAGLTDCGVSRIAGIRDSYSCNSAAAMPEAQARQVVSDLETQASACLGIVGRKPGWTDGYGSNELKFETKLGALPIEVAIFFSGFGADTKANVMVVTKK